MLVDRIGPVGIGGIMCRDATAILYYGCEPVCLAGTELIYDDVWRAAMRNKCDCISVGRSDTGDDYGESYALGYVAESALENAEEIDLAGLSLFERSLDAAELDRLHRAMAELKWPADKRKIAWRLAAHYG